MLDKLKANLLYYRDDYPVSFFEKDYPQPAKYPKIALVKQEVYADLYCCPPGSDAKTIVCSSLLRSGFVGLFTKCGADFIIVKEDPAPECQVWKEFSSDPESLQYQLNLKDKLPAVNIFGHTIPQGNYAQSVDEVDWSQYDIIISINISVPERVTAKHPSTVWAYCIGEPYMDTYQSSREKLVRGYDLFLNQKFRRRAIGNPFHEIDFPYYLQYYGSFNDLLGIQETIAEKKGVIIEKHSLKLMKDQEIARFEELGPIYFQEGNTEQMLQTILHSKYYYRVGGPRRWGNAMIESAAGGCLFLGNKEEFVNKSLFSSFTHINSMNEFFDKVEELEKKHSLYKQQISFLSKSVTRFCFNRPIGELIKKSLAIKQNRLKNQSKSQA